MAAGTFEFAVGPAWTGMRLDAYLAKRFEGRFSRTEIKRAVDQGHVRLNNRQVRGRDAVKEGDRIEGILPSAGAAGRPALQGENIELRILHEDASILVVDKPAGMVVHPGAGNRTGTLVHALLGRRTKLSAGTGAERPGIVHRLDKETSGVLVVAKTNAAHRALAAQFAERSPGKVYRALAHGRMRFEEGRYEEPIGRHRDRRILMAVRRDETGKPAETRWKVLRRFAASSDLEIRLLTGRTHQIRVHLAHAGHPILGDRLYAPPSVMRAAPRLMLHAARIEFLHPRSGKLVKFESPLPDGFRKVLDEQK